MKKILLALQLSCLLFAFSAFADNPPVTTETPDAPDNIYLFVQSAKWGTLKPISRKAGTYKLVLHGVPTYVSYFSSTDETVTGMIPTKQFLSEWRKGQTADKNELSTAGVRLHGIFNKKSKLILLNLSQPVYDAKHNLLTLTAHVASHGHAHDNMPKHIMFFRDVVLFIDHVPGCWSCVIKL